MSRRLLVCFTFLCLTATASYAEPTEATPVAPAKTPKKSKRRPKQPVGIPHLPDPTVVGTHMEVQEPRTPVAGTTQNRGPAKEPVGTRPPPGTVVGRTAPHGDAKPAPEYGAPPKP